MNVHFEAAVKAVVAAESKSVNFWKELVLFVKELPDHTEDAVKQSFKREESNQTVTKKKLSEFGAYRSAKSVIVSAAKLDVALMDGDKVRGKTEVEKDIKALKGEGKSELDKFKAVLQSANAIADKFDDEVSMGEAFMLAKSLTDKLADMLALAKKAA